MNAPAPQGGIPEDLQKMMDAASAALSAVPDPPPEPAAFMAQMASGGLPEDAMKYLDRLSPGHKGGACRLPGGLRLCSCPRPVDAPGSLEHWKTAWMLDTCGQVSSLRLTVRADRIRNAQKYRKYRPEPGFRLRILREMVLLMASGHIGGEELWNDLLRDLVIDPGSPEMNIVEQALTELKGREAPADLRFPHGDIHPDMGLATRGAPGSVCLGKQCGGRGDPKTEELVAVFESRFRAHLAADDIYAVASDGPQIGRAPFAIDPKGGSSFGASMIAEAYERLGKNPGPEAVANVTHLIRGRTIRATQGFAYPSLPVRVTTYGAGYLIDLGDPLGQYVEVTPDGWQVISWRPGLPVMLASARPLPVPVNPQQAWAQQNPWLPYRDPRLDHLGFTATDPNWHQIRIWQATAFFPEHERPLLLLTGASGSGKTKRAQSIAAIVDPLATDSHGRPVLGGPLPDDDALAPELLRSYLFTSDNISGLGDEDSDRLCRISTGYRFIRRVLYTTSDTYSVVVLRAGLLTGVEVPPQLREDAQNRILHLELDANANKRPSAQLDAERWTLGPAMFGALLDDMALVLRAYRAGQFDAHDRFPIVSAAAQTFGPEYVASRTGHQQGLAQTRAEGDTQLAMLAKVVKYAGVLDAEGHRRVRLTPRELYDAVCATQDFGRPPKGWAGNPQALTRRLGHNRGTLAAFGITRRNCRTATERYVELTYFPEHQTVDVPSILPVAPLPPDAPEWLRQNQERGPFVGDSAADRYAEIQRLTTERGGLEFS
jgi:hypothetical protein